MSELGRLAESGAPEVLRKAVKVLVERGWTQGATRDLQTGEVDILGAIAIAAGAPIGKVNDGSDVLSTAVPEARRAAAMAAWETLEWACDGDPVWWQDRSNRSFHDVVRALNRAADRLSIAVR